MLAAASQWWYSGNLKPFNSEQKSILESSVGAYHASKVKVLADEWISRSLIYQAAYNNPARYQKIFKALRSNTVWLQDKKDESFLWFFRPKIFNTRVQEGPEYSLIWAQGPGKIYIAYPQEGGSFLVERFLLSTDGSNVSGIIQKVSRLQLQEYIGMHKNIEENKKATPLSLLKIVENKRRAYADIKASQAALKVLRQGKDQAKKRKRLRKKIEEQETRIRMLNERLQSQDETKSVVRRENLYDLSLEIQTVRKQLNQRETSRELQDKFYDLSEKYAVAFDAL